LTERPRSAGSLFRKIVAAIVLVPLAIVIIAFAVANRQMVTVSLDPFSSQHPAADLTLPLFALMIGLLILGVALGGLASWLRHGRWRRMARRLERDMQALRDEVASLRRQPNPPAVPDRAEPPQRLKLRPPVQ
jgi:uncharacterized integral membrane protein